MLERAREVERAVGIPELAGERVAIQLVAVDEGRDSIVEVGVDDVRITTP